MLGTELYLANVEHVVSINTTKWDGEKDQALLFHRWKIYQLHVFTSQPGHVQRNVEKISTSLEGMKKILTVTYIHLKLKRASW